ncbi:hypothetical protein [Chitinophaga rhizosphaerae]|uniref:hypothetical protein n=1 Tax=Chitinophaga rhizosphaerae TaxID=1864947 RepID=UPI000F800927|nr:hypothetical protein [Chitinophaga rhizosphaerae]
MKFSFKRSVQLLKLQLVTDRKLYLYGVLGLFAAQLSVLLYYTFQKEDGLYFELQESTAGEWFFIFTFLMAAAGFRQLNAPSTRLRALMLPVSVAEYMVVEVFIIVALMPLVFFATYFVSAGIAHYVDSRILYNGNRFFFFNGGDRFDESLIKGGLTFITIGLAASAIFKRYSVAKAIVAFAILFVFINAVNDVFSKLLLKSLPMTESMQAPRHGMVPVKIGPGNNGPFSTWYFQTMDETDRYVSWYQVHAPEYILLIENIAGYLMLAGLVYLTVLKLRERQLS